MGRLSVCLICCSCWLALLIPLASGGNPDAKRLYDDLLSNYNKIVRPVVNNSDVLTVRIKLKLSQLIDLVSSSVLVVFVAVSCVPLPHRCQAKEEPLLCLVLPSIGLPLII